MHPWLNLIGMHFAMESPSTQSIIRQASQSIDDPNLTGSGSRRPGNVWSTEAREDLFRRRELGEGWETLCAVNTPS